MVAKKKTFLTIIAFILAFSVFAVFTIPQTTYAVSGGAAKVTSAKANSKRVKATYKVTKDIPKGSRVEVNIYNKQNKYLTSTVLDKKTPRKWEKGTKHHIEVRGSATYPTSSFGYISISVNGKAGPKTKIKR